jgi:hypothetical protein
VHQRLSCHFPDGAFVHSRDVTFDESVTRDSATVPWAVESESGIKMINPSPEVTDALGDLLAAAVSSSESPDSESSIVCLDVHPAGPVHACHLQCDDGIPRSFQQAMKSPLAAACKHACDDEMSWMNVLKVFKRRFCPQIGRLMKLSHESIGISRPWHSCAGKLPSHRIPKLDVASIWRMQRFSSLRQYQSETGVLCVQWFLHSGCQCFSPECRVEE